MRERNVAVSRHVHNIPLRLNLQMPLKNIHKRRYGHRRRVPQVKDPVRRWPLFLPTRPGTLPGRVQRSEAPLHDVVNVGEIPGQVDPILAPVDRDGLPLEDVPGEGEIGHVGSAPRAVHREEPQPGDGKTVNVVVRVRDLLPGLLCRRVQACRPVRTVRLGEGHLVVQPVHRAGRGPDDRRLGVGRFAGLEERDEPGDVAVDVRARVLHGVADPGLGREVHHVRERYDVEELFEEAAVVHVPLDDEDSVVV
ncbi:hypothetical protein PanWU01x14_237210 [Parasponia andersonii]|uniref:Uncharacterized protein n=1 Tax=Parasponia andersonii TaxID=3476 RepID=A0A2P5BI01_PARAD|nr:hypothetical protein PanWU01x14_237210 [Parasponia andersonii]